jgi:hypothetical protein
MKRIFLPAAIPVAGCIHKPKPSRPQFKPKKKHLFFALFMCSIGLLAQYNPNNAYINSRGCIVCDQYAAGDTFSLDAGTTWYTVVDRPLLESMRDNEDDLS